MTIREAHTTWMGGVSKGTGRTTASSSHQFRDLPVSWPSRVQENQSETSPEELVAAAHASCFAMALAGELERAGQTPEQLDVRAQVHLDKQGDQWGLTEVALNVEGQVSGISEAEFQQSAERAKESCLISKALQGNVRMRMTCTLKSASPA